MDCCQSIFYMSEGHENNNVPCIITVCFLNTRKRLGVKSKETIYHWHKEIKNFFLFFSSKHVASLWGQIWAGGGPLYMKGAECRPQT